MLKGAIFILLLALGGALALPREVYRTKLNEVVEYACANPNETAAIHFEVVDYQLDGNSGPLLYRTFLSVLKSFYDIQARMIEAVEQGIQEACQSRNGGFWGFEDQVLDVMPAVEEYMQTDQTPDDVIVLTTNCQNCTAFEDYPNTCMWYGVILYRYSVIDEPTKETMHDILKDIYSPDIQFP